MSKKKKSEYELIPVKPLRDLKKEIQQLKRAVTEENSFHKILVKHMNLDVQLQRELKEALQRMNQLNQRMDRLVSAYENTSRDDLIANQNIRHEERHKELLDNFQKVHSKISTRARPLDLDEFRERNKRFTYKRTKRV